MKADADARPQYAFSGDGFHPATALQAKLAQIILNTFRARWPSPAIPVLTDAEIRTKVLGL
jgi:phospholipase/lecithinase/hemolysin